MTELFYLCIISLLVLIAVLFLAFLAYLACCTTFIKDDGGRELLKSIIALAKHAIDQFSKVMKDFWRKGL